MRLIIAAVILFLSIVLLFTQLGHYALWDDEAVTALAAKGVWKTGDTSVIFDNNIMAYRGGLLLRGMHERSTPPLGAYIAAPFVGPSNGQAWLARLPFVCIALVSVILMLWWLYRLDVDSVTWIVFGLAVIGNVSFWLYDRQCRYYAPAIFSSIAVAYLYLNWNGSRSQLVMLAAASIMLLAANYLNYLALQICLLVDYLIIGRKRRWLTIPDWIIVLFPQVVIGGAIVMVWNTLGTGNIAYIQGNTILQRLQLVYMNLRDINTCEYGVGVFLVAAPFLYFTSKNNWFWRAPLVLLIYVIVVSMVSPQVLTPGAPWSYPADVRYLTPVIPLCMAIGVMVVRESGRAWKYLPIFIALVAFETNLLHANYVLYRNDMPPRSTLAAFIGELNNPPTDPHTPTAKWIRENVRPTESIWVIPGYNTYPLMFHAPKPTYAWQLNPNDPQTPVPPELKDLPAIHFQGRSVPDYIISYGGPVLEQALPMLNSMGLRYQLVWHIDVFPLQTYRPELFWHTSFKATPANYENGAAIYILKHVPGTGSDRIGL